jgi:formylglycine-generating enzyme required for sulfatase activity
MQRSYAKCLLLGVIALLPTAASAAPISIDTVVIGNAGNGGELSGGFLPVVMSGGVTYEYRIGTYEVTVGQYTAFLNAIAASDPHGLYNESMATNLNVAGITRSGTAGSYSYSVIGSTSKPVTYVSWGDSARFANWLHNGQPTGAQDASTTEQGAYSLNGAVTNTGLNAVTRSVGAQWFLPTEDEWYKAAYHKNDGVTANYWDYPTSTDATPYSDQPPGADAPSQSNTGNFFKNDSIANGYDDGFAASGIPSSSASQNYLTEVGAYSLSQSPYGTFDQGGNVWEWNEALINFSGSDFRGIRGGSWGDGTHVVLQASARNADFAIAEDGRIGFRVATVVPEPTSWALAIAGALGVIVVSRRVRGTRRIQSR